MGTRKNKGIRNLELAKRPLCIALNKSLLMLYHFPSSAENNCLLKGSVTEMELAEKTANQKRAGELIDLNHQCKLAVGTSSQTCLPPGISSVSHETDDRWGLNIVSTIFQLYQGGNIANLCVTWLSRTYVPQTTSFQVT